MFGNVGVHSGQRVVQQVDISVTVQGSGQAHPLPLSTGEVDPLQEGDRIILITVATGQMLFMCIFLGNAELMRQFKTLLGNTSIIHERKLDSKQICGSRKKEG